MARRSLARRCRGIEFLLMDVDGVLSDGQIIYTDRGEEIKAFHVRDGAGIALWNRAGKRSGILTGRGGSMVQRRARELGLSVVVEGAKDKFQEYRRLLCELELTEEQVCYVGDDIPDLPVLRHCGLAVTVADACAEVQGEAHYVTGARGGHGAVREVVEMVLKAQGLWSSLLQSYRP